MFAWKTIGTTVETASARTLLHNRVYGVALAPLGQAYAAIIGGADPAGTMTTAGETISAAIASS